ncbi:hypothetical protein [Streptomyces sp. NPDC056713]|uniref:hypothetical protein n=1 Tax=Streptomyces sp. NPDC056713 TaxID=3345921 RepID=UPI00369345FD
MDLQGHAGQFALDGPGELRQVPVAGRAGEADAQDALGALLVKRFDRQTPGTPTPDGRTLTDVSWTRVRFDIVLRRA